MIDWVVWWVPWYAWAVVGVIAAAAAWRLLGWQGIVAVVAGLAAVLGYQHTRRQGYQDRVDDEAEGLAKQQGEWDEIDRQPRDFDAALGRMRDHKDRG